MLNPLDGQGGCKKLEKLKILGTGITTDGVMLALNNLPNLKHLGYNGVGPILGYLRRVRSEPTEAERNLNYKLVSFDCKFWHRRTLPYTSGDLAVAVSLCPDLTKVTLSSGQEISEQEIAAALTQTNKLTHLRIFTFTFASILPILRNNSIQSLTLAQARNVDLNAILRFCPRLRHLELRDLKGDTHFDRIEEKFWPKELETFQLITPDHFPAHAFLPLLSSPVLAQLSVSGCSSLTDQVLVSAFQTNNFCNLQELWLSTCSNVTKAAINLLMTDQSQLCFLGLHKCGDGCNMETRDEWRALAQRNNWQLDILMR